MSTSISDRLLDQRLRNGMIERLQMLVDWTETIAAVGAAGYFNSFFDVFPDKPPLPVNTVLSSEECEALTKILELMDQVASCTRQNLTDDELVASAWPMRIGEQANSALSIMMVRGKLSDDVEVPIP
ncbi:hypothetical protein [Sphingobium sp.]|uniref:hypothetical protein n=1 Tax=Sphingobium sp. TaxID=1912891 RepID=UPI003BB4C283